MSAGRRCVAVVIGLGFAAATPSLAGELTLSAPKAEAPAGSEAIVSLRAKVDAETSALQGGLSYDPTLVDVVEVTTGAALPEGARADFNADQPGWLRLGFVCSPNKGAFRGDGEVLRIRVRAKGAVGAEGTLRLAKVRAWEPNDSEHRAATVDGSLRIVEATSIPWIPLAAGVAFLLILALLAGRRRRARSQGRARPSAATAAVNGSRAAASATRGRFCTSCGAAVNAPAARFCGACGKPVA